MTTRRELQQWLEQFPENASMEVLLSQENNRYGYSSHISVHETEMALEPANAEEHPYYQEGQTFTVTRTLDGAVTVVLGRNDA